MMRWTAELSPGDVKEVGWQILDEKRCRFSRRCHYNRRYESNVEIFTLALQIATRHFVKFRISTANERNGDSSCVVWDAAGRDKHFLW